MSEISVYEYKDYKKFVRDRIEQGAHQGRGLRKELADAIGCQTPFITHVLGGDYHFSAEQAEACARWMKLEEPDLEMFILLVLAQRAATKGLAKVLNRQISERRARHSVLKNRVAIESSLSIEDQLIYCSSWIYSAVHLSLLNPANQTFEALESALRIPAERLQAVLDFLIAKELVKKEKSLYKTLRPFLHFELGSPILRQHHTNWRLKAIEAVGDENSADLHYSGVISLSQEDFEWIRERLSTFLEEVAARIKNSPDEKIAALTFDWFKL